MARSLLLPFLMAIAFFGKAQPELSSSTLGIGPVKLSFKKPPVYETYSPCKAIFINYTNVPLQVNRVHESGRFQKLIYIDALDTVEMATTTNHHLIICFQGSKAGSMFIPAFDVNVIKIHDKQFNKTKKIPKRKYKPIKSAFSVEKKINFKPVIKTYGSNGPVVLFDHAHLSGNTKDGLYKPLATLLEKDGYQVGVITRNFTESNLKSAKIIVMSNVYGQSVNGWLVDSAQALVTKEVAALKSWVNAGGKLLLIADHAPFPSRVQNIGAVFGFDLWNCMISDTSSKDNAQLYNKGEKTLKNHAITEGRNDKESVDQVALFTGSCMGIPKKAKSLITLNDKALAIFRDEDGEYTKSAEGMSQAAVMNYGEGKIAVFCESEMFTALNHKPSKSKIGMNYQYATENPQFILNVFHWLDGFIE